MADRILPTTAQGWLAMAGIGELNQHVRVARQVERAPAGQVFPGQITKVGRISICSAQFRVRQHVAEHGHGPGPIDRAAHQMICLAHDKRISPLAGPGHHHAIVRFPPSLFSRKLHTFRGAHQFIPPLAPCGPGCHSSRKALMFLKGVASSLWRQVID
nr:hypothetical protein [Maricaulis sp.]